MERLFGKRALLRVLDRPAELTTFDPIAYFTKPDRAGVLPTGARGALSLMRGKRMAAQSGRSEECLLLGLERTCRTGGLECALNGGTVLGGGFDSSLGVAILVLRGAEIAERGVESASIVDLINEAWKVSRNVLESFVGHQIHGFNLESLHEALGFGVVVWITAAAHRTYESVLS